MEAFRLRPSRWPPVRQIRLFVARHPLVHWTLIGALSLLTGGFVLERTDAADRARERWGSTQAVMVAARALPEGHRIVPGDLRQRSWPVALAPPGAVASVAEGTIVASSIAAGEPVIRERIGRAGAGPVAAVLALNRRAVAIPIGEAPPPVAVGDRADLVAAVPSGARVVATGAQVVEVHDHSVVIAVGEDELPAVASGLVDGTVVIAVSGADEATP